MRYHLTYDKIATDKQIIQASNDVEKGDPQIPSVGIKLSTIVIKNSTVVPQRVNHTIHRILESPYWVCIQEK